jgi:endonuclease YncB( thermonuclease family)
MHVRRTMALCAVTVAVLATGCNGDSHESSVTAATVQSSPEVYETTATVPDPPTASPKAAPRRTTASPPPLYAASGGDGDSWKDTHGREYRMGLVNAPEYNECFGSAATTKRKALVARGFRASVYTTDTYGRSVSVITLPDGTNLNVWMARRGYANDTYLATYRHENPALATKLDAAFAAAKGERVGLWGACSSSSTGGSSSGTTGTTGSTSSSCHPDYVTCIPIKGDGSGNGDANDLDCPDIGKLVTLRHVGVDPYRLDADGDGYGCDSYA